MKSPRIERLYRVRQQLLEDVEAWGTVTDLGVDVRDERVELVVDVDEHSYEVSVRELT